MVVAYIQYVKLFVSFLEFVYFQDKDLSLISLSLNMLKTVAWKSRHWHLGIGVQM